MNFFDTNAQIITNIDPQFKALLLLADNTNYIAGGLKVDINNDNEIDQSEVLPIYFINVSNYNLSSIIGVNNFVNLVSLSSSYNQLTSCHLSNLVYLERVFIVNNALTSLTFNNLPALNTLCCSFNQLTILDVSNLPNLKKTLCSDNQLTNLDFSNNPLFYELGCKNNNLTSINIKNGFQQQYALSSIIYTDCWKEGNPNLTNICVDASEISDTQNFLNSCGASQTINVSSNCGLGTESFETTNLKIFPNPSKEDFTINFGNKIKNATIEVYNYLGQLNQNIILNDVENYKLQELTKGIYFVKISADNSTSTQQIVKE